MADCTGPVTGQPVPGSPPLRLRDNPSMTSESDEQQQHPIAFEVIRKLREAKDRSDLALKAIVDGGGTTTYQEVLEFQAEMTGALIEELTMVAYMLDELTSQVRALKGFN